MIATVRQLCTLQPHALEVTLSDQVEKLDELIHQEGDGAAYFEKTFVTAGMRTLVSEGMARLAGKSSQAVFHLKQAMGGGKTHSLVAMGLLAKNSSVRKRVCPDIPFIESVPEARVAAFNGRNEPDEFFWGEIAKQLGHGEDFRDFWANGPKAPAETDWITLFQQTGPTLILLDELPPYFNNLATKPVGTGTVADIATRAFANLLSAAQKMASVCVVVSDLSAAYQSGSRLINQALEDARSEVGRQERTITPVDLATNEVYEILRKRLFATLPSKEAIEEIASAYGRKLQEAVKAGTVNRSAEAIAEEVVATYPFHPRLQNLIALFKENEKFKQTRGLIEIVSRLLKSVWGRERDDVFLIGGQHFDLSMPDVRDKLVSVSEMGDVVSRDLWSSEGAAHAQVVDNELGRGAAREIATLLLTASLSTAVNAVKGLTPNEIVECLIHPYVEASDYNQAFEEFEKLSWYLHRTPEGKFYFDRTENLTKMLQTLAKDAPDVQIEELVRRELESLYRPHRKTAYEKVLALPTLEEARQEIARQRTLLIVSPDSETSFDDVQKLFEGVTEKNNFLVLTGERSAMASLDRAARQLFAAEKADARIPAGHHQRADLERRREEYRFGFTSTIKQYFDRVVFPYQRASQPPQLVGKALDVTTSGTEGSDGERQIENTLTSDPIKLYLDVDAHFDALREKAETCLWPASGDETRWSDSVSRYAQNAAMVWLPPRKLDDLKLKATNQGKWEDLGNGYVTKVPRPKTAGVQVTVESGPADDGKVRLRVNTVNAGPNPKVHYAEDAEVSTDSPVLQDAKLETRALRVRFLAVDTTGKNPSGEPYVWTNEIKLRCEKVGDGDGRRIALYAAPRGTIRYTLDGSEPRGGIVYTEPVAIGRESARLLVFAEADGVEAKESFQFPAVGDARPVLDPAKPALLKGERMKKLDGRAQAFEALTDARERDGCLSGVELTVGQGARSMTLSVGEIDVSAEFLLGLLERIVEEFEPGDPVVVTFLRARFQTGHDLQEFCTKHGLEFSQEEVEQ